MVVEAGAEMTTPVEEVEMVLLEPLQAGEETSQDALVLVVRPVATQRCPV